MHPYNLGELVLHARGEITTPLPCTPRGVIELLKAYDIDLDGKEVCVLGRGITIGRTIGLMLTRKAVNATVTLCHTGTKDVRKHMREADIIVAAMAPPVSSSRKISRKARCWSMSVFLACSTRRSAVIA